MTLKDCTKEELLFIIEHFQCCTWANGEWVRRVLNDVGMRREERKLEEARRLAALQNQKMQEYISLMCPYEGRSLMDVPEDVLNQADAAIKEARSADMKWRKLMGICAAKPAAKKRRPAPSG